MLPGTHPLNAGALGSLGALGMIGIDPPDVVLLVGASYGLLLGGRKFPDMVGGAKVIHLATQKPASNPDVLIAISTQYERKGSYTNFEGKVNKFEQVFDKPELALHASDVFGRL